MFTQEKAETTRTIWKFLIGGMVLMALFLSELGILLIPIYAMMLIAASITTHSIWNGTLPQSEAKQEYREKAKRERLDNVIRNLSTQELQVLRDRLSTGVINEDDLYGMLDDDNAYYIDDDGELSKNSG